MNTPSAEYWIKLLQLQRHPEGGFFKETYRSGGHIEKESLPPWFSGKRNFCTAIYFLLCSGECSLFHRIKSDELWNFYIGSPLTIYVLSDRLKTYTLGAGIEKGESFQLVIPANVWFGAKVNARDTFTLAGCTVAPGFDFEDFELAHRDVLLKEYPNEKEIVELLTK
jgi:predicted cupin superfamily sugar epimerase